MKIDLYAKIVLTVIAVCLVILAFRPTFVTLVEAGGQIVDVRLVGIDESPYLNWEAIPVKIE